MELSRIKALGWQTYLPLSSNDPLAPRRLKTLVFSLRLSWKLLTLTLQVSQQVLCMFSQHTDRNKHGITPPI